MNHSVIQLAAKVPVTEAEGPGKRFAIWVQGCPFRCPGCCNPQYLDFRDAEPVTAEELLEEILSYRDEIEGVTLIGGEPFAQAGALAELAQMVREQSLSVMIFTGYRLEKLHEESHQDYSARQALLNQTDLLVDGLYRENEADTERRWIGSTNQKIHFLTDRYAHLQDNWPRQGNTLEIRMKNGQITINGFPHQSITRMSKLQQAKKEEG